MWRAVPLVVLAIGCGQRSERRLGEVHVDEPVTVSKTEDRIEPTSAPAIAVGSDGLLVTWETQRRSEEDESHIVARLLTRELVPIGDVVDVGLGTRPAATVGRSEFVVGWTHAPIDQEQPLAVSTIGRDGSIATRVTSHGVEIAGTTSLDVIADAVVAVGCSTDYNMLVIARERTGDFDVERRPIDGGCNDAIASGGHSPIALVHPRTVPSTEVVEISSKAAQSPAVNLECFDLTLMGANATLVCFEEKSKKGFVYLQSAPSSTEFKKRIRTEARTTADVVEAHAVPFGNAVFIAWTTEVAGAFQLTVALLSADGRLLTPEVTLPLAPTTARFSVVSAASSAWVAFVAERQLSATLYRDEVVVMRIRVSGT